MSDKKTLVIGASEKPDRYSNMAINSLRAHGHTVVAIGEREGQVGDVFFNKERKDFHNIDTITLYINPARQPDYYDYLLSLHPKRIIFNPGTENPELAEKAATHAIEPVFACTLVLLRTGQY